MYQSHFHLHDRPFSSAANPEHYFPAASVEQARESIARNVERRASVTMVTGPVGCGKTLLCQLIANQYTGDLPVCLVHGENVDSPEELLQSILHGLGLPFHGQDERELRMNLANHMASPGCVQGILLIIDDADRLSSELLAEIRAITNIVREGQPCVRVLLVGSPRLDENLVHPELESLNQRIVGRLYLDNFGAQETADYVRARIAACGGDSQSLFTEEALVTVHRATNGVPRLINQICDHGLVLGTINKTDQLTGRLVEEAWADLQQLPIPDVPTESVENEPEQESVIEFGVLDETSEARELVDIERSLADLGYEASQAVRPIIANRNVDVESKHPKTKSPFSKLDPADASDVAPSDELFVDGTAQDLTDAEPWDEAESVDVFEVGSDAIAGPEAMPVDPTWTEQVTDAQRMNEDPPDDDLPVNDQPTSNAVDQQNIMRQEPVGLRLFDGDTESSIAEDALTPTEISPTNGEVADLAYIWNVTDSIASFDTIELLQTEHDTEPAEREHSQTSQLLPADVNRVLSNTAEDTFSGDSFPSTLDQVENPFGEAYPEEEVILQDFVSPSSLMRESYDPVTTAYSQQLALQLSAAHPGLRMHPAVDLIETEDVDVDEFQPLSACLDSDRFVATDVEEDDSDADAESDPHVEFDGKYDPVMPEPADCAIVNVTAPDKLASEDECQEDSDNPAAWDAEAAEVEASQPDQLDESHDEPTTAVKSVTDDEEMVVSARIEPHSSTQSQPRRQRRFGRLFSGMRNKTMRGKN